MPQTRYYKVEATDTVYKLVDGIWRPVVIETVETEGELPNGPDLEKELSEGEWP